ncbi:MAG: hypothetical protein Q8N29_15920 [Methylobacter sp.]|nr:hypothetical protein [Methylobacter sp.]
MLDDLQTTVVIPLYVKSAMVMRR